MSKTPFQRVAEMNVGFGNPKGDPNNIDWARVQKQCLNIPDEVGELFSKGFGANEEKVKKLVTEFKAGLVAALGAKAPDVEETRDALADIQVFKDGAVHMMGYDGDRDMEDVVDGVMTRYIKDEADKQATIALHAAKGVTEVYFEGEFPKMVMKSAKDQPDAPKGKFLKSASYRTTVWRPAP